MKTKFSMHLAGTALACLLGLPAHATEGGGLAAYPDGLENFMAGAFYEDTERDLDAPAPEAVAMT